jgi:DNA-binding IclR family transcriptional regulator
MTDIQSIKRAFSILKTVANYPYGITLAEVTDKVALPKSTVNRMLLTLESIGAIERLSGGEGFRIGPEIKALAMQPSYLVALTRPRLHVLAETTGETVTLCLPDGDKIYYAAQVDSQYSLQVRDWTGQHQNLLHVDSSGKLFLAHWPQDKRERYLAGPMERFTPQTIADPTILRQHLTEVRTNGYAWVLEEFEIGLVGVSAPIWNQDGEIIAAINVSGPKFRFPQAGEEDNLAQLVVNVCHQITEKYGK